MAKYSVTNTATASTTLDLVTVYAPASAFRRGKLYDFSIGSAAAPADTAVLWQFFRTTAAPGTPTSPSSGATAIATDGADAASVSLVSGLPTTNGTHGVSPMSVPLNQRATYRWVASPGGELVYPATAGNGLSLATPTSTAISVTATIYFEEQ